MARYLALWIGGLGVLLGALAPVATLAQSSPGTKTLSDTVALSRTGKVAVDNQKGSIRVTTWDRSQVGYEVTLVPSEGDSVLVSDLHIEHTDQLLAFGRSSSWSLRIPGVLTISPGGTTETNGHYRIVMPDSAELEIADHASTIEVSGVKGAVDIETHEGEVSVRNVEENLQLETFSGTATATGLRGGVELETHSGRITASFEEFSEPSSAETHSGSLRFFLPADAGFTLQLDLDEEYLSVDDAFGSPSSKEEARLYNGGGPALKLESFSGEVTLRPRKSRNASSP